MSSKVLGRGLSSLLTEKLSEINNKGEIHLVPIGQIEVNPHQHRKFFDNEKLNELARSIASKGLLQPIIVNWNSNTGKYHIIAGERRFRACQIAKIKDIHVIIKDCTEREIAEIALTENIQRENITVIEEVNALAELMCKFNYTQDEIAKILGKSRSYVGNMLRLTQLPISIIDELNKGNLTVGHARSLIGLNTEDAEALSEKIINNQLNVRQTEKLVNKLFNKGKSNKPPTEKITNNDKNNNDDNDDISNIEDALSKKLGMKVLIEHENEGGRISVFYETIEDLDVVLTKLDS